MISKVLAAGLVVLLPLMVGACDEAANEAKQQPTTPPKSEKTTSAPATASSGSTAAIKTNLTPEERAKMEEAERLYQESQKTLNRGGSSEAQAKLYQLKDEKAAEEGKATSMRTNDGRNPSPSLWNKLSTQKKQ
jgi:hypothetical protein